LHRCRSPKPRDRRDEERTKLRDGKDPVSQRRADKLAANLFSDNSFEGTAREWMGRPTGRGGKRIAPITQAKNTWLL